MPQKTATENIHNVVAGKDGIYVSLCIYLINDKSHKREKKKRRENDCRVRKIREL